MSAAASTPAPSAPAPKIVPATDAEGMALAKAMDVGFKRPGGPINWDSPDHDKVVHRKSMVAKAKEHINAYRGCVLLGLDTPAAKPAATVDQPQGSDHNTQTWPVDSGYLGSTFSQFRRRGE